MLPLFQCDAVNNVLEYPKNHRAFSLSLNTTYTNVDILPKIKHLCGNLVYQMFPKVGFIVHIVMVYIMTYFSGQNINFLYNEHFRLSFWAIWWRTMECVLQLKWIDDDLHNLFLRVKCHGIVSKYSIRYSQVLSNVKCYQNFSNLCNKKHLHALPFSIPS